MQVGMLMPHCSPRRACGGVIPSPCPADCLKCMAKTCRRPWHIISTFGATCHHHSCSKIAMTAGPSLATILQAFAVVMMASCGNLVRTLLQVLSISTWNPKPGPETIPSLSCRDFCILQEFHFNSGPLLVEVARVLTALLHAAKAGLEYLHILRMSTAQNGQTHTWSQNPLAYHIS